MADLSTMPEIVNVTAYGGDTLTLHVKIDTAVIAGRTFFAQVRSDPKSPTIDATFGVILTATGADIVLLSADTLRLTKRGEYEGHWDVQLAEADHSDPVTTLGYGELRLHPDVTRPTP